MRAALEQRQSRLESEIRQMERCTEKFHSIHSQIFLERESAAASLQAASPPHPSRSPLRPRGTPLPM